MMGKGKKIHSRSAYERVINNEGGDRVRKGYFPVMVGMGDEGMMRRLCIPTRLVKHPYIVSLLELSACEFGFQQEGMLKIPFDPDSLGKMVKLLSKKW